MNPEKRRYDETPLSMMDIIDGIIQSDPQPSRENSTTYGPNELPRVRPQTQIRTPEIEEMDPNDARIREIEKDNPGIAGEVLEKIYSNR